MEKAYCRFVMQDTLPMDWEAPASGQFVDRLALQLYAAVADRHAVLIDVRVDREALIREDMADDVPVLVTFFTVAVRLESEEVGNWESHKEAIRGRVLHELAGEELAYAGREERFGRTHVYFF